MAKIDKQTERQKVMFSKIDTDNLFYEIGQWMVQHVNMLIGWAMLAVSVALEPVAQQPKDILYSIQEVALANEYAIFIARLLQIVAVVIGIVFMIKGKKKNGQS